MGRHKENRQIHVTLVRQLTHRARLHKPGPPGVLELRRYRRRYRRANVQDSRRLRHHCNALIVQKTSGVWRERACD